MNNRLYTLVAVFTAAVVMAAGLLLHSVPPSVGFEVLLLRQGPAATWTDHWGNNFVVQRAPHDRWAINGVPHSRDDVRRVLQQQLCTRAQKVAVFNADPQVDYAEAIESIDFIKSTCDTKVVLLTPATKKVGWERLYLPPAMGQGDMINGKGVVPIPAGLR